eukprot:5028914-Prorocentrum_lima.AAC.1
MGQQQWAAVRTCPSSIARSSNGQRESGQDHKRPRPGDSTKGEVHPSGHRRRCALKSGCHV